MLEKMVNCGPQLNEDDIRNFEKEAGVSLPPPYKAFLLKYDGGQPSPDAFPIEGMPKNPYGIIQMFFGIRNDLECYTLKWIYDVFKTDTPRNLFPIACTPSDDSICLSLSGQDAGSVLFWDYYAPHSPSTYDNVYKIAGSFDEFIQSLFRAPESQR
jgi:hypothetical protein